ncbi:MAG TPA: DUF2470 domain-containing protein [Mycobacteriales bacterium]|nr:DUF2470 domain-containing protein [Mycobacteriales bacterium]
MTELTTVPSPAERARTLALGVVTGVLHLPATGVDGGSRDYRVQHLTGRDGEVTLLVQDGTDLHQQLTMITRSMDLADVPSVLDVLDVPPGQLCLPRARLCITGWVDEPTPGVQRQLAAQIAAARPVGSLLDVGTGWTLYRLEVAEIRVTTGAGTHAVEPGAFAAAEPDPLYEAEDHVVGHLEQHHRDQTIGYALRQLAGGSITDVTIVGLDRYGIDLLCAVGSTYEPLRAPFSCRVTDDDSLSRALGLLLREQCSPTNSC